MSISSAGKHVIASFLALTPAEQARVLKKLQKPHPADPSCVLSECVEEDQPYKPWMTLDEAAEYVETNKSSVSRYTTKGHIRFGKLIAIGGHWDRKVYHFSALAFLLKKMRKDFEKRQPIEDQKNLIVATTNLLDAIVNLHLENGIDLNNATYRHPDGLTDKYIEQDFWSEIDRLRS